MDFVIGTLFGALLITLAVAVSITYEPYSKVNEYRAELGLEEKKTDKK